MGINQPLAIKEQTKAIFRVHHAERGEKGRRVHMVIYMHRSGRLNLADDYALSTHHLMIHPI
jgi:hypothetical protein